jgi:hypothetical protein
MIPKSGYRFSACAKPLFSCAPSFDASAGEGRSDKIMREQKLADGVIQFVEIVV